MCLAYIKAQGTGNPAPTADKALLLHPSHYDTAVAARAAPRFSGAWSIRLGSKALFIAGHRPRCSRPQVYSAANNVAGGRAPQPSIACAIIC